MKETEKPRNRVVTVRPTHGSRSTTWDADCGDCGPVAEKSHKSKDAAVKAATKHGNEVHGGAAVLHVRQG